MKVKLPGDNFVYLPISGSARLSTVDCVVVIVVVVAVVVLVVVVVDVVVVVVVVVVDVVSSWSGARPLSRTLLTRLTGSIGS